MIYMYRVLPLHSYTVSALKWWLAWCRIKVQSCGKKSGWQHHKLIMVVKKKLLVRVYNLTWQWKMRHRIWGAKQSEDKVVDVDGLYLWWKYQRMSESGISVVPLDIPSSLLTGWESVTKASHKEYVDKIPQVTYSRYASHEVVMSQLIGIPLLLLFYRGTVYVLGRGLRACNDLWCFPALIRGFLHWSSGRMSQMKSSCIIQTFVMKDRGLSL